jgi:hypothetical protein
MLKMGSHVSFEYLKHKLWPKEKSAIALTYLRVDGMPHIVEKFLRRVITFL